MTTPDPEPRFDFESLVCHAVLLLVGLFFTVALLAAILGGAQ